MQSFDLKWPKTTATLFSNGWRCRIVWRTDRGMGGAIDNNDQCKRRIADSLTGAPKLLEELRNAGFEELAKEVEALAENTAAESPPPEEKAPSPPKETASRKAARKTPTKTSTKKPKKPSEEQVVSKWVRGLEGTDAWADADTQRAMKWHKLLAAPSDAVDAHEFHLKTPPRRGTKSWVLRRSWPNAKRGKAKPEFFTAENFRGVCVCLLSFAGDARSQVLTEAFAGCVKLAKDFDEVGAAVDSWTVAREDLQKNG
ncbi:MAG: hypothetical protein O7E57_16180 [Gammaproteobacteria bacterium]|nr:hypothetical protein [Gammaproteobacteria bacterium]